MQHGVMRAIGASLLFGTGTSLASCCFGMCPPMCGWRVLQKSELQNFTLADTSLMLNTCKWFIRAAGLVCLHGKL